MDSEIRADAPSPKKALQENGNVGRIRCLKKRQEFLRVADERRKWVSPGFILQAAACKPQASTKSATKSMLVDVTAEEPCDQPGVVGSHAPRGTLARSDRARELRSAGIGFTVSKRVGNAVQRNRVRRRLRAAVERTFPRYAEAHTDYVLIGRVEALARPFTDLLDDLCASLKRIARVKPGTSAPPPPAKGRHKKRKKRRKGASKKG